MNGAGLHGGDCAQQHPNQASDRDAPSACGPAANSTQNQKWDANHTQQPDAGSEGQVQPAGKIQNQPHIAAIAVFPPEPKAQTTDFTKLVGVEIPD
ncbi:MAG: Uncharacterised protein [Cyanobium sp. ARS6]|nr:MAG: Uncharacterised protein [Cyanobium sp. ARS6]